MKKLNRIAGICALAFMLMPLQVFTQSKIDNKVLMTIGDEPVTVKEFVKIYEKNNGGNSDVVDKKTIDEYLDLFVNFKIKVLEAENLKLDTNPQFVRELDRYRSQLAKPYFSNEEINESLVNEARERYKKDIRASHILVKVSEHALPSDTLKAYNKTMEIRRRALNGEDFGELAYELSDDPSARDREATPTQPAFKGNRGDLGYFTVFDMVYPFETAAYKTPVGQISMPVRTSFGYHLIKVTDVSDAMGTATVAHIFISVPEGSSPEEVDELRNKSDRIFEEITEKGEDYWDEAVNLYSDDRGTKQRGGRLTGFTVSRIVPEFVAAVKSMKIGEISKPVRTNFGFHIIKLLSIESPLTMNVPETIIKSRIEKDMRSKKSEEVVVATIKKENGFKEYGKNIEKFVSTVDSTIVKGKFVESKQAKPKSVLFKIAKQKYTVANFIDFIKKNQVFTDMPPRDYAMQLYTEFADKSVLMYEDAHLEEKYEDFKYLVREYHDGILLFDLMDRMVWTKAGTDTVGLEAFFEANRDKYMWGERVEGAVVRVLDKANLDDALAIVRNAEIDPETYRDTIRNAGIKAIVRYGYYQRGDDHSVDNTEWNPGIIKVYPSTVDNSVTIVRIVSPRAPEHKKLKEARGIVTSDYQVELERKWLGQLKEKYPVTINQKVLEQVKEMCK